MRTKDEINQEIKALKKLVPVGQWKEKTTRSIAAAVEELEHGYDDTAEEWNELSDSERDGILNARQWKEGDSDEKPSEGWGSLVKAK